MPPLCLANAKLTLCKNLWAIIYAYKKKLYIGRLGRLTISRLQVAGLLPTPV